MRNLLSSLPSFFKTTVRLGILYIFIFTLFRIFFCAFNLPNNNHEAIGDYVSAYVLGLRFDLIIISYLLMFPALVMALDELVLTHHPSLFKWLKIFVSVVSALVFFISAANIPYFSQFGSHINKSILVWRLSPGYSLQLIFSSFAYWGFLLLFLAVFILFVFRIKIVFREHVKNLNEGLALNKTKQVVVFLALALLLVIAARGRLASKSTMHEGMAIVNQNAFMNQIALNPNFTLIKSLSRKESNADYLKDIEKDLKICKAYYPANFFPVDGILNKEILSFTPVDSIRRLNVIVVLMESMTTAKMGFYKNKNLSPHLTELAKKSVFFDRFFSSGIHTFNGLFSSATGFPSIYTEQGLRQDTKKPFITLANLLKPFGYQSTFCVSHDPVFDNMEGFFKLNGYDHLISSNDFKSYESIGVTGVPDHLLYHKLIETINIQKAGASFLAMVMTGTDHGPWHIPTDIPFKPSGSNEKENASLYADWSVKTFMDEAKKQTWYANTVFVFLGDHGQIMNDVYDMPITYHHVPLIVHCPKFLNKEINHNLGSQADLVKTLSSLLKVDYLNFSFGLNLFKDKRDFVSFSADDKLGFVTKDDYFFYHLLSNDQKNYVKYKEMDAKNYYQENKSKVDSIYHLSRSLYHSAQYYIKQNYFNF